MTERLIFSHSQKLKNDLVAVRRELVIDEVFRYIRITRENFSIYNHYKGVRA